MALSVTHLSKEAAHPQQLKQPVLLPRLLWRSRASRPLLPGDERLAAAQGTRLILCLASSGGRNTLSETLSALPDIPACSPSLPLAVAGSVAPRAAPEQPGTGHQPQELHHPLRVPRVPSTLVELSFPTALAALTLCCQCLSQRIHVTPLASPCLISAC